ncbi:MAG: mandelate racemase/muconate lactonizing enzyme family protein [Betaproteobacteria bacterium]
MEHRIAAVKVHLVSEPVSDGFADATRKVESIGYLIVRVMTDTGLEGIGITYNEVGGEATRDLIEYNMVPRLVGQDPLCTEVLYADFTQYMRGVGRKGLMFCALSAVDLALWDLKGKIFDIPLYRLLGGNKTRVPVYASGGWTSYSDEELVAEALRMVAQGYTTIKLKVGVDGGRNLGRDVRRVAKVRDAIGPDISLLLDANNCWNAATAARFANRIAEFDILFLEEPVFADDIPGLAQFKNSTDLPLATGEHEYTKFGARDLILAKAVDVLQLDGARAGGYTEMLKIAAIAQAWNIPIAPHAMEHMHLHLAAAVPNVLFVERLLLFETLTARTFVNAPMPKNGYMEVPDLPGMGLTLDMDYIRDQEKQ